MPHGLEQGAGHFVAPLPRRHQEGVGTYLSNLYLRWDVTVTIFTIFIHFLLSPKRPNTHSNRDMVLSYLILSYLIFPYLFLSSSHTNQDKEKQIVLLSSNYLP